MRSELVRPCYVRYSPLWSDARDGPFRRRAIDVSHLPEQNYFGFGSVARSRR